MCLSCPSAQELLFFVLAAPCGRDLEGGREDWIPQALRRRIRTAPVMYGTNHDQRTLR